MNNRSGAVETAPWGDGAVFRVKVRARARREGVDGFHGGALRVSVPAAPSKGGANRALLVLLARLLGKPVSSLSVVSGAACPDKRVGVKGMDPRRAEAMLAQSVPPGKDRADRTGGRPAGPARTGTGLPP